jgi:hypothetical protein
VPDLEGLGFMGVSDRTPNHGCLAVVTTVQHAAHIPVVFEKRVSLIGFVA